jgi:cytochrome c553
MSAPGELLATSGAARPPGVVVAVLLAAIGAAACGDSATDQLLSGSGPAHRDDGAGQSAGQTQSNPGGTSTSPGDGGAGDPGAAMFQSLLPALNASCGSACHAAGTAGAPAYLAPPDAYGSIKAFPGIVVSDPSTSVLLTKGRHEGPDLLDPLRSQVEQWLQAEAPFVATTPPPSTDPFAVQPGTNEIDISKAAVGLAGAKLSFNAAAQGTILTLSNIQVLAPPATGVHVVAPVFVVIPQQGAEVPDTSFSNADQTIQPGQSASLQPGMLILTDWSAGATMRIEFAKLEAVQVSVGADGGGVTGGCKAVAQYQSSAVPAIQQNGCLNCHDTGGSGNGALDMSALAANPPDYATACNQALTRANPQNPPQSDIVLAPTGGVAAHPFKNASSSFAPMMEAWIGAEK